MPKIKKNKKPRKSRAKKTKKALGLVANASIPVASSYLDSILSAIVSLSPTEQVAFGLSICSLFCTAIVIRQRRKQQPTTSKTNNKPKHTTNKLPLSLSSTGGLCGLSSGISSQLSPTVKAQINKSLQIASIKGKIPTEEVTKIFQCTLSAKRPNQALMADNFYHQILNWTASQLDFSGQSIVVNYLLWYYRTLNVSQDAYLTVEQSGHIRYWADFQLKNDTEWGFYNIKFDYMYTVALLSKSVPHLRVFYNWLLSEDNCVRHPPPKNSTRKQNYYLTRFQTACILGKWSDVYRMAAEIRRLIEGKNVERIVGKSSSATSATSLSSTPGNEKLSAIAANTSSLPRTDYFMHYTLKALEQPCFNPNFSMMYQSLPYIEQEFGSPSMLAPPVFTTLHVYQYRYRNMDENVTQIINNSFVFTSDKFLDEDGYYKWYPMQSAMIARVPKVIKIWGRICQMMSPLTGSAGFLPMTGTWSDTKIYMQTDWTYRAMRTQLTRKQGILELERTPIEQTVKVPHFFGSSEKNKTGYLWKGKLSVYTKQLESTKISSLSTAVVSGIHDMLDKGKGKGDGDGDKDGDRDKDGNNENMNMEGNGNVFRDLISEMDVDDDISLMIYDVELVIASDEWENIQKEREKEKARVRMKELLSKAGRGGGGRGRGGGGRGRGRGGYDGGIDSMFDMNMSGLTKSQKQMKVRQAFGSLSSDVKNINVLDGPNGYYPRK